MGEAEGKEKDKGKGQVVNINSHQIELYLSLSWLFQSLTKYLLSKFSVPGTVLGPGMQSQERLAYSYSQGR